MRYVDHGFLIHLNDCQRKTIARYLFLIFSIFLSLCPLRPLPCVTRGWSFSRRVSCVDTTPSWIWFWMKRPIRPIPIRKWEWWSSEETVLCSSRSLILSVSDFVGILLFPEWGLFCFMCRMPLVSWCFHFNFSILRGAGVMRWGVT